MVAWYGFPEINRALFDFFSNKSFNRFVEEIDRNQRTKQQPIPSMDGMVGLLKVQVVRGINLAYRDARGSDPYVVLRLGKQKLKTSVKKRSVNPIWHEELTLSITSPTAPIKLGVFDKDTFSRDDPMGDAEIDLGP
uniref:C2 domain-containing protein n=1 Tax=Leersia perrieri TaxID=77586 RepID=A0A0D9WUN8_9ORYZ